MVGLGAACQVAAECMPADHMHVEQLSRRLLEGITQRLDGVQLNGDAHARYPGNVNLSFAYVEGESLLMGLKVRAGDGDACGGRWMVNTEGCVTCTSSPSPPHAGSGGEQWQRMHQRQPRALVCVARIGCG